MQRSAYVAAIDHLTLALTLLPGLSDLSERDARELQLQSMLGSAWMATRGFAVAEVGVAYERARDLCRDTTETADIVRVLAGLGLLYINRGELRLARDIGEQLLGLAERRQERELLVSGHELLGLTLLRVGDLIDCRSHMERAIRNHDVKRDGALRDTLDRNPVVSCLAFGALALWLLGYPDQAVAGTAQALRAAHAVTPRHPFSLGYALLSSVWVHQFRREPVIALRESEAAAEFATEQGFPTWLAHGLIVQGWAEAELGSTERGVSLGEEALATYETTGATVWKPLFSLLYAHALADGGRTADALESVTRALAIAAEMGTYWWEAELFRVRGELLLALSEGHCAEAKTCFERALSIAREQDAKSLELRACLSLARLAHDQGDEAQALLELGVVYEWFSEGFNTVDLIEAREFLQARG
jgi:predicted ATPase